MKSRKKLLFIFGTRPEAIKMAPLIKETSKHPEFTFKICVTGQHRELLDQVLHFFKIRPDFDLHVMKQDQTLFSITADIIKDLEKIVKNYKPDIILVQGDTTTAFVGALVGYYCKIKVVHIEAGLRSGQKYSPFPEEMNRIIAGHIADYHFAPTKKAVEALAKESITKNVFEVGNTSIDALLLGLKILKNNGKMVSNKDFANVDFSKKIILVTAHRRESFGNSFENICKAIKDIVKNFSDVEIVFPVHPNPNIRKPAYKILAGQPGIHLLEPLDYPQLLWIMEKSYLIMTDSGGIQEEAPSLGKPVLVMRDFTERTEGIDAGTAILVGTNRNKIFLEVKKLLQHPEKYNKMSASKNPYGDGLASKRIFKHLKKIKL